MVAGVLIPCCLTLPHCAPNRVIKSLMCNALSIYGTLHVKDPLTLSISSHRYGHPTMWRLAVGHPAFLNRPKC